MTAAAILIVLLKITIVLILALAATRLAHKTRASVRHVLLAAAFAVLLILPIASLALPSLSLSVPISEGALPAPVIDAIDALDTSSAAVTADAETSAIAVAAASVSWASIAIAVWIAGTALFLVPVVVGLWQVRSLRRASLPWHEARPLVDRVAAAIGLRRRVDVLVHECLPGPMTCGVVKPAIILPADAHTWTSDDLHRAIVHELEHVRRADWISQCVARVIAAGYWFHPIVWVAWRQLSLEAERACDDAVLRAAPRGLGADPAATAYADQLVTLARRLSASPKVAQLAMANRDDLSTRVLAVLDARQPRGRAGILCVGGAIAVTAVLATGMSSIRLVAAQNSQAAASSGPTPKYDAATVKPCVAEENPTGARGTAGGTNAKFSPGRFYVPCVTVEQLIYLAYASYGARDEEHLINDDPGTASNAVKVRGGPAWVHSLTDKYEIEATAIGATERTVLMGSMLQSLLEERFSLKLHRDTEEVPLFALGVAKSGLKLKPMKDGDCDPNGPGIAAGASETPKCGQLMMLGGTEVRWTFGGFALSGLASQLSRNLGVHVLDKTGVADKFVYTFTFQRGEDVFGTEASISESLGAIGLTLEKTKGPRGFLVIDSIERPSPDERLPSANAPARAQGAGQADAQRFAVASIKPCEGGATNGPAERAAGGGGVSLNTITVRCQAVVEIIARAYMMFGNPPPLNALKRFDPGKITGGPAWARSDRYEIEAKADGTPGPAVMMGPMLRALLEERFQLTLRQEITEVPALALTVAATGLKVKPVDPSSCTGDGFLQGPPGPGDKPRCNSSLVFNGPNLTFKAIGQSFAAVTQNLGPMLFERVVVDQTAASGLFTFSVEFARDENTPAREPMLTDPSNTPPAPSVFTAFEKQLGLKFVPAKAQQGHLVIDRITRPSPDNPASTAARK